MRTLSVVVCLLVSAAVAQQKEAKPAAAPAQTPAKPAAAAAAVQDNPYSAWNRHVYGLIQGILLRAAEKMPEADYGFRPAETVRTYGQIVGHLADSQYYFCSTALGEPDPAPHIEKTKTAKADLIAALKESSAYCDKAYGSLDDTSGRQMVKLFGRDEVPKLDVLHVNDIHDLEHYGNLATYLRIKNLVPPTSEPQPAAK